MEMGLLNARREGVPTFTNKNMIKARLRILMISSNAVIGTSFRPHPVLSDASIASERLYNIAEARACAEKWKF